MLKINRRTDYAVRVGVALAKQPLGTRLPTHQIKEEMLIPRAFLQRIISELSQAHLIQTFPGPSGGIQLARPPEEISLRDIVDAMEGPLCISDCLIQPQDCPLSTACPVRGRWGRLERMILAELEQTSLAQLAAETLPDIQDQLSSQSYLFSSQSTIQA
ncbi:MAG: RrF2 family transcriptional regulator [Anaerolineales bacterium]|jgi:Rrf2 family protein